MSASYPYRRSGIAVRVMNVFGAACCLVAAALYLASHHLMLAIFMLVVAIFNAGLFVFNTKLAHGKRAKHIEAHRPHPDYALIAAMEREAYGETFRHDGSPVAAPLELARDANERTPAQARIEARPYACESCGAPEGEDCRTAGGRLATWPHPVLVTVCCCAKCRELDWRQR
jgi:hypothetical protein